MGGRWLGGEGLGCIPYQKKGRLTSSLVGRIRRIRRRLFPLSQL